MRSWYRRWVGPGGVHFVRLREMAGHREGQGTGRSGWEELGKQSLLF